MRDRNDDSYYTHNNTTKGKTHVVSVRSSSSLNRVPRTVAAILVIATTITLSTTFIVFVGSLYNSTALAETDSATNIINQRSSIAMESNSVDKNVGSGSLADIIGSNSSNNIITSIIGNTKGLGGFSVNAAQNKLGLVNNITTAIIGNTSGSMQKISLSGKIASSQFNLQTGNIEATLFGNWSLQVKSFNNSSLSANFTMRNYTANNNSSSPNLGATSSKESIREFRISNLKINSFQQITGNNNNSNNTIFALGGTADLTMVATSQNSQTQSLKDKPISITIIQNRLIIFSFNASDNIGNNRNSNTTDIAILRNFNNLPIIGIVTTTSR